MSKAISRGVNVLTAKVVGVATGLTKHKTNKVADLQQTQSWQTDNSTPGLACRMCVVCIKHDGLPSGRWLWWCRDSRPRPSDSTEGCTGNNHNCMNEVLADRRSFTLTKVGTSDLQIISHISYEYCYRLPNGEQHEARVERWNNEATVVLLLLLSSYRHIVMLLARYLH